jgi:hypothetical protein
MDGARERIAGSNLRAKVGCGGERSETDSLSAQAAAAMLLLLLLLLPRTPTHNLSGALLHAMQSKGSLEYLQCKLPTWESSRVCICMHLLARVCIYAGGRMGRTACDGVRQKMPCKLEGKRCIFALLDPNFNYWWQKFKYNAFHVVNQASNFKFKDAKQFKIVRRWIHLGFLCVEFHFYYNYCNFATLAYKIRDSLLKKAKYFFKNLFSMQHKMLQIIVCKLTMQ